MGRSQKRLVLVPEYLKQFACIGSQCEDTCCAGWRVDIDQPTYKKYQAVRHLELKPLMDAHVKRNREEPNKMRYAYMELQAGSRCPFLNAENLCSIQAAIGEEYLSLTCTHYPRVRNEVNGLLENSLTLACPEAARLALLNPDGIVFTQIEEPSDRPLGMGQRVDCQAEAAAGSWLQYFWELRVFTIEVLQNRSFSVADRLVLVSMFYAKVDQAIAAGEVAAIPQLIAAEAARIADPGIHSQLESLPAKNTLQMVLLKQLADHRFSAGEVPERYLESLMECLAGLGWDGERPVDEIGQRYQEVLDQYYLPFMQQHEYLLENYVVNQVFLTMVPYHGKSTPFTAWCRLLLQVALIKLHLIGISGLHQGLTPERVVKAVQSLSKAIEHNQMYLDRLERVLTADGLFTLAGMVIMTRN